MRRKTKSVVRNVSLVAMLASQTGLAHVDTVLQVSDDGTLSGLPDEYEPAHVRVIWPVDETGVPSVSIQFSGHAVDLPVCIARLFAIADNEEIRVSASWYHKITDDLPAYANVDLPQETSSYWDQGAFSGHHLLFDLTDGRLLEITRRQLPGRRFVNDDVPGTNANALHNYGAE